MFMVVMNSILRSSKSFIATTTTTSARRSTTPAKILKGSQLPTTFQQQYATTPGIFYSTTTSSTSRLFSATSSSDDIKSMRAKEIKEELESYGIPTVSFVEKSELIEALESARAQGLKPKKEKKKRRVEEPETTTTATTTTSSSSTTKEESKKEEEPTRPREERLAEEMENCKAMKATDLKKELQERGISTASFFEKSDFVKALAEARVDNFTKGGSGSDEEGYAEYTDVEVLTDDASGPRQRRDTNQGQQSAGRAGSPFGGGAGAGKSPFGGANPFGGGAGMGAGMGGMGGIADILKNVSF
jgi:hypothetical protein